MPASLIKDQLGDEIWAEYFKFCVVRNPYDKAVSEFFFHRRNHKRSRWLKRQDPDPVRFERWLESSGPTIDRDKYLIDGEFCLNDVIRYETLSDDMQRICNLSALPWEPTRLQHFKRGLRPDGINLKEFYTEKSKELVQAAFAFEISHFGYSFPD